MNSGDSSRLRLYHTGWSEIRMPDIHYGRKNADLGQGVYLTPDEAFARRWAKEQKQCIAVMNTYELRLAGLTVHRFDRDLSWYDYLFANRSGKPDSLDADVIVGPIANDTLYDTFGIITSGFLKREDALRLLQIGPEYVQVVIKTEKAARQLAWLSSQRLESGSIRLYQQLLMQEQTAYQEAIGLALENSTDE